MPQDIYADCVNGELRAGDLVISIPGDAYGCLIGTVLEIKNIGTPEYEARPHNNTKNVHVDFFDAVYSDKRIREIEAKMSDMLFQEMEFGNCPLDDVVMAPNCLIRISGIEYEKLQEITDSNDNAIDFCNSVFRECRLIKRLNQNLVDYHNSLIALSKKEIIGEAGMIAAMSDAHYYLTANHVFSDSEVEYLLLFRTPLEVIADKWYERSSQLNGFSLVISEEFERKDAVEGGYQLYIDPDLAELRREKPIDENIQQAARHEAERILYELRRLKKPNHPGRIHYSTRISPVFIRLAGTEYNRLLIEAFQPEMPMLIGKAGQRGGVYLSMTGAVRARVKVLKAPIKDQLREAAQKVSGHNSREDTQKHNRRDSDVL